MPRAVAFAHAAGVLDALRMALPQACALCGAPSGQRILCMPCARTLPVLGIACPRCALPAPQGDVCAACARRAPPWTEACAAWRYAFPVDRLVHALKYGGRLALAEPLADGLAAAVRARAGALPDCIVPLPLAPSRQHERGFNQAELLAARLARRLDVPVLRGLARVRASAPQAALPLDGRAANVRGAFAATRDLARLRVALVDDVMTTGATLAAAARAARDGGAREVRVWVVGRTLR